MKKVLPLIVVVLLAAVAVSFVWQLKVQIDLKKVTQPQPTMDVPAELTRIAPVGHEAIDYVNYKNSGAGIAPDVKTGMDAIHEALNNGHCPDPSAIPEFLDVVDPKTGTICPKN